jgi:hypothetical protein
MPLRSRLLLAPLAGLSLLFASCVSVKPRIEVTPGAVPDEIEMARWAELPVRYCIASATRGYVSAGRLRESARAAFEAWGVEAVDDGDCPGGLERGNGSNEIGWGQPPEAPGRVHEAGFTELLFRLCPLGCEGGGRARVVEADIYIDPEPATAPASEQCLDATVLHEVGHFLGLPHLDPPALMAPVSTTCEGELTQADRAALRARYDLEG